MILETKISIFKSTRETSSDELITIGEVLSNIKRGTYSRQVAEVRAGDAEAKKGLPTVAFHGIFNGYRKKTSFIEASGLIILDIDDISPEDSLDEIKADIIESDDSVLAAMVSPSGNGIKVLYYVQPDLVNAENYRQIGKQIVGDFEVYGNVDYLSVTDCLIVTHDPSILINKNAIPAFLYIKDTIVAKSTLEPVDETRELWDDPEDFFDTVLANDIMEKTNNNFHYIQVAILDLAKFGFTHPKEDLSFVVDYAEGAFHQSNDNKTRFNEVTELAKDYPQLQWPYKMITGDGYDDDGYIDYSDMITDDCTSTKKTDVDSKKSESNEVESNGLIDYSVFFDSVLKVAREGDRVGYEVALKAFADIFRFRGTGILTVTGIPGHGKTEFVDALMIDLSRLYGHEVIIAGFEQTPEEHVIKLIRKMVGVNVTCPSYLNDAHMDEFKEAYKFVTDHVKHIEVSKTGGNINLILEVTAKRIKESRDNGGDPKYVVIDPFNMLSIKGKFSGHEKIEEILRRLTHFSHQMGVLVILVAHPFKMRKDEKTDNYEVPDFYSVKGSSAFFEMSYHGLVIYRTGYTADSLVMVRVLKVKQNSLGTTGEEVYFKYDKPSGRYVPCDEEDNEDSGDHRAKDWVEKAIKAIESKRR